MSAKPTKKQRKASEFKNRKLKGREEPLDVPLLDDPEVDDGFGLRTGDDEPGPLVPKEKGETTRQSRKRKHEEDVTIVDESVSRKRSKIVENEVNEDATPTEKKQHAPPKYILFVGNLSYKTSVEAIANHFSTCDPPPTIRRLTRRGKSGNAEQEKSKGCAFLEFSKASGLQTALRLHHSVLDGRKINVELSAGGGGRSETRMKKLKEKNAKLDKHRLRPKGNVDDEMGGKEGSKAKTRLSETSGGGSNSTKKRTWSVPRKGEQAGRGGKKHRTTAKTHSTHPKTKTDRPWTMTGANAIPVG